MAFKDEIIWVGTVMHKAKGIKALVLLKKCWFKAVNTVNTVILYFIICMIISS